MSSRWLLVFGATLAGCGGGAGSVSLLTDGAGDGWSFEVFTQEDSGVAPDAWWTADGGEVGVDVDVGPAPGEAGHDCTSGAECNSGFCVLTPDGQKCSVTCLDECPFGWQCMLHAASLPDEVYICAPAFMNLCRPCNSSSDCLTNGVKSGDACVPYGPGGSFCGAECEPGECPAGFQCKEVSDSSGTASWQCVLSEAECQCKQWYTDELAWTTCHVENEFGKCEGQRVCTGEGLTACDAVEPAEETCDGEDNDCNGKADEGTGGKECFKANGNGACTGHEECVDGVLECDAKEPLPEACDGVDNNCNDKTDEGFPDSDEDGTADCLETDKDGDGVEDYKDNCPFDPNPGQADFDLDGKGDACDLDDDNDLSPDGDDCAPYDSKVAPGADEKCNGKDDNCNGVIDEGFADNDGDKLADCVDDDDDNDGFHDDVDCMPLDPEGHPAAAEKCDGKDNNCNGTSDEGFEDTDMDGVADCMELDKDGDGLKDSNDNCPGVPNQGQEDMDKDGIGDVCDSDLDGDGIPNKLDNCDKVFNPLQGDLDSDGQGDACDTDKDGDAVPDVLDNCPETKNPGQADLDADQQGDTCDSDDDGDGVEDSKDNCPKTPNPGQTDTDKDGTGDACEQDADGDLVPDVDDNCPLAPNPEQTDCDGDGKGSVCDADDDGDGIPDKGDNCLCIKNPSQADADTDGQGDECDTDKDGDGVSNGMDNCPAVFNPPQGDIDGDGIGDKCDDDKDGDGVPNGKDNCPDVANFTQADFDKDGAGDACDADDDGDGEADVLDCAPLDPAIHSGAQETCNGKDDNCASGTDEGFPDNDLDGFKDCVDKDDDNDGHMDVLDCAPLDPAIHPGAKEKCNGLDDDCNGLTDEVFASIVCGQGECSHIVQECKDGKLQFCNPFQGATKEICDGKDNNCNGSVDEDFDLGGPCVLGVGQCADEGQWVCAPGGLGVVCSAEPGQPKPELCDGQDNNCNGKTDEDFDIGAPCVAGIGECQVLGLKVCEADGSATKCGATPKPPEQEKCDGKDNDCDGGIDPEGAQGCKTWYLDSDSDGYGLLQDSRCLCAPEASYSSLIAGDCDDTNGAVNPGVAESCVTPDDDDCSGAANEGCALASCKAWLSAVPGSQTGKYSIDPDGNGPLQPFLVLCDMESDGGGWTLIGVASNSGPRYWNSVTVFSTDSSFGSLDNTTAAFKSPAYKHVAGNDFLVETDEYSVGYKSLLSSKSMADFFVSKWPGGCSSSWLHGKPEYVENLTLEQAKLFAFTLRGWDDNANCFPNSNENSAISLTTAECCWVNGIGNNTCCQDQWVSHDLSLLRKSRLVSYPCTPNQWPCTPEGVTINDYHGGNNECYDTSCKVPWARMWVR